MEISQNSLDLSNQGTIIVTIKPIFNISIDQFIDLVSAQVDLTQLYLLYSIDSGIDIVKTISGSKVKAWHQTLVRKGWVKDGRITESGKKLLSLISSGNTIVKSELCKIENKVEDDFERWWKAFPSNDIFVHKGREFIGNRGLRGNKEKCRIKFMAILKEGEYKLEDMIRALEYEVLLRKENSVKTGENKLQYLSGTEPYLNQRKFESFMEISKEKGIQKMTQATNQYNGFDI